MFVKEHDNFRRMSMTDFGLREIDTDAHVRRFFMVTKVPKERVKSKATDFAKLPPEQRPNSTRWAHTQSAAGKATEASRRQDKRNNGKCKGKGKGT